MTLKLSISNKNFKYIGFIFQKLRPMAPPKLELWWQIVPMFLAITLVFVQIQTRHVRDYIQRKNTIISFKDRKIIMFDHKDAKPIKIFELSFCMSNLKNWSPKKYEVEGPNKHNPNQFIASQNLLNISFKWFYSVIFSPRSSVFEDHFQEPSTLQKVKTAMGPLVQNLE